jgi:aspartyl/asparaginyl beta-hydroxylase (cupin superfamily)
MPDKFEHIDGGLNKQLKANLVDNSRPMMERVMSGVALLVARGLLEQINQDGLALPDTAPSAKPLDTELPSRKLLPEG